jgi:hypothetical protein
MVPQLLCSVILICEGDLRLRCHEPVGSTLPRDRRGVTQSPVVSISKIGTDKQPETIVADSQPRSRIDPIPGSNKEKVDADFIPDLNIVAKAAGSQAQSTKD